MHPEIQKAVDAGKLSAAAGQTLEQLQPGTYVVHKSWGFGQVDSLNFLVSQMTINFKTKKGHTMQLQYAAESLQAIATDHILALKAADPIIRNDLLLLFSNQKATDLQNNEGREKLRAAALVAVKKVLAANDGKPEKVDAVLFTTFVMQ